MPSNEELETYDPGFVPQRRGLSNAGAICHFNSLLQALISCSAVVRTTFRNRNYLGRTPTGRAFYDFVHAAVEAARPRGSRPFEPTSAPVEHSSEKVLRALVADLRRRRPDFNYGPNQESVSEGLVLLLDMIDDPDPGHEENPITRLFSHRYDARVFCKKCEACVSQEPDGAAQFNLFYYDFLQKRPRTPPEFGEMLRSHVSYLEDYWCERCGERPGGFRHYRLRMVPEILVCLFYLYTADRRVARYFPAWVSFPSIEGGEFVYRQVSQIEHSGHREGGHYVARGLRADGKVYTFNDLSVARSEFGPSPDVYMVVYHCDRVRPAT